MLDPPSKGCLSEAGRFFRRRRSKNSESAGFVSRMSSGDSAPGVIMVSLIGR